MAMTMEQITAITALTDGMKPFDGHFWVEKDGKIIDRHFDLYDFVKKVNGCKGGAKYHPAPPLVQTVMIALAKKTLKTNLKKSAMYYGVDMDSIEKTMSEDIDVDEELDKKIYDLREAECHITAFALQKKYGGEIVFGSMGWEKKTDGGDIHWEYGGADWTTVAKFQRK